jgi:hypothetical protein
MELNEQEDEDLEAQIISSPAPMIQDDDDSIQLPEEWMFELQDRSQLQSSTADASINVSSTFGEHSQKTAGCREMLQDTQSESMKRMNLLVLNPPRKIWKKSNIQRFREKSEKKVSRISGVQMLL